MIRTEFGCSVSRFAELVGVPRRTYHAGDMAKGPWPAPQVDRIEPTVAKLAAQYPAWGHRKIWAMGAPPPTSAACGRRTAASRRTCA